MKGRPILFSGEMVRAILEGRKTMTRRVAKTQPSLENGLVFEGLSLGGFGTVCDKEIECPYGQVGDRLWVKEAHYAFGHWEHVGQTKMGKKKWAFVYDSKLICFNPPQLGYLTSRSKVNPREPAWYKRNSLFMPRWASRITLEIAATSIERLNDITEADAMCEGVEPHLLFEGVHPDGSVAPCYSTSKGEFCALWEKINGAESLDANPWVWVIEFRRLQNPVDNPARF